MALDALALSLACKELNTELNGYRIDKVFQPSKEEVLLQMRGRNGGKKLLLSVRSGSARVAVTGEAYENPQIPPSFCMLLRKHLVGGRVAEIRAEKGERLALLSFDCVNEMGDNVLITLAIELMGRYCNIVLISNDGKILDALKRISLDESVQRQLLPGLKYELPQKQAKPDFISLSPAQIIDIIKLHDLPVVSAMQKSLVGTSPAIFREIAYRAFGPAQVYADELSGEQQKRLTDAISDIQNTYFTGGAPTIIFNEDGSPLDFSFLSLTQYLPTCTLKECDDFSKMMELFYAEKDRGDRMRQKSKNLRKQVQNLHDRAVRKQAARAEELKAGEESEHLRIYGELITANIHTLEKGLPQAELFNWYTGEQVKIPLNGRLSPSANAQKYFKDYKKHQTAVQKLKKFMQEGEEEIIYLQQVLYELDVAENEADLEEVRIGVQQQGYRVSRNKKNQKVLKHKLSDFLRYRSADGYAILVGRNNLQNDKLSTKVARGRDFWFHVHSGPGSHVIVQSEAGEVSDIAKTEAALLAAYYSKQRSSAKVAVDYTEVKNLRKTVGLPIGMVLYEKFKTAFVTPEEAGLPQKEEA